MTSTKTAPRIVHALVDGLVVAIPTPGSPPAVWQGLSAPQGTMLQRGDEVELTPEVLEANRSRTGVTPWDDIENSTRWAEGPVSSDPGLELEVSSRLEKAAEDALDTADLIAIIRKTEAGRQLLRSAVLAVYKEIRR